ncbi:MAG: hypothetical protein ACTSXX_12380 [Candidatus Baldrarchaeia archaeon]
MSDTSALGELNFEKVWEDILEIARMKKDEGIRTLTMGVLNQIVSVSRNAIIVKSKRTGKERALTKEDFRCLWETLRRKKQLDVDDIYENCYEQYWKKIGRIMMAFLAHLPYVEYSLNPQKLYLMPSNTHPLGTVKKRF